MFTRISKGLALCAGLLTLSACGFLDRRNDTARDGSPAANSLSQAEKQVEEQVVDDGKLSCAVGGASEFSRTCLLEQNQTDKGLLLVVRHPDGGFRKLQVVKDGRGVIAADGADQAKVDIVGPHEILVTLAGDRYRIPANTAGPKAAAKPVPASTTKPAAQPAAQSAPAPAKS